MALAHLPHPDDQDAFILFHLPLARRIARRFTNSCAPLEDLNQVAALALVKAASRYDPARGTRFATFATPTITGELRHYLRDCTWAVHVPRGDKERAAATVRVTETLWQRHGRAPTVDETAAELGVKREQVDRGRAAERVRSTESLDAPVRMKGRTEVTLADQYGAEDENYEYVERRDAVRLVLPTISERDRYVLYLRFACDLTQADIAEQVGVSQMQVSRIIKNSLERLREAVEDGGMADAEAEAEAA